MGHLCCRHDDEICFRIASRDALHCTAEKKRLACSSSGSSLQKSQPTMVLVWLQQMMRRASYCSLNTRGELRRVSGTMCLNLWRWR